MADHTEQLVGILFRILSKKGYVEAQQALLNTYQSQATAERGALTEDLLSTLLTILQEQVDSQTQVDILATAVDRLFSQFTAVVEAAPVAIFVVDEDGKIQFWNDGAERTFGWRDTEVRRQQYPQLLISSDDTATNFLERIQNGEQLHGIEAQHTQKNGAILDVRIWATPIQTQEKGDSGAAFIITDITDEKQREQRLAVLNRVLRHNIRNDVNIIQGNVEMLADDLPADNEHIEVITDRLSNIVELSQTARNIEQLQNDSETKYTKLDLAAMLRERVTRLCTTAQDLDISTDIRDTPPVVAHELLPYALDNILDNAIEHNHSATPKLSVTTSVDPTHNHSTVTVADNGPGLPPMEKKVLTAETETSLNHSSGLGLWLTRWIVRSSDGIITVDESEFGGTRLSIQLRTHSASR